MANQHRRKNPMSNLRANNAIYTEEIRDTDPHKIPPVGEVMDTRNAKVVLVKVINGLDAGGVVELRGSTFDDMQNVEDVLDVSVNVAAGETHAIVTDVNWATVVIVFTADTPPTTGELKVVFQTGA